MDPKKARLESALFLSDEPIDTEQIADILDLGSMGYVDMLLEEYKEDLEEEHRGLELVETPEGYELKVKSEHIDHVSHLAPHQDLNEGQLRTLSLIAYNAPVEQADIVEIRGNRAYQHVKELVSRGFIDKEKDGRTAILDVTGHFLDYFDLESVDEFKRQFENEQKGREAEQEGIEMFEQ
jgi:segregation and condensation protein B